MKPAVKRNVLVLTVLFAAAMGAQASGLLKSADGMTLYIFDKDKDGMSACYEGCAVKWPPYLAKDGETMKEEGWTQVKRTDGTMQWAYDGKPVYFYEADKKAGDMAGEGVGGVWHTVAD